MGIQLTDRQLAYTLAALRYVQQRSSDIDLSESLHFHSGQDIDLLSEDEVDDLCEQINVTSDDTIVMATFETRNFEFQAFGASEDEAMTLMRKAWGQHVAESGADPTLIDDCIDDVSMLTIRIGEAYRDRDDNHDLVSNKHREVCDGS